MELQDFINKFSEQFDDTESSVFKPDTHFKELEDWSSLVALSVIAMIDEEYDISLKGDDLLKSDTIQELFECIKSDRWRLILKITNRFLQRFKSVFYRPTSCS